MKTEYSNRLNSVPPYLFVELERRVAEKEARGEDVINLGIGDPDIPTPGFIREALAKGAMGGKNHNYSSSAGEPEFRKAVAEWYGKRFGVAVDESSQVCSLLGSKEGIANVARAFVNPGDAVLVPDPAYSVYRNGATLLCDGVPVEMPLSEGRKWLLDLDAIPKGAAGKAKMMYLNYPNNPTGAVADKAFLKKAVDFCLENGIILCYDNAYSEFTFGGLQAPSILEIDGAGECAIEFCSLSKTFCMTGDRIGYAVGNPVIVAGLKKVKGNIDSGPSVYVQKAAIAALSSYTGPNQPSVVKEIMSEYEKRLDFLAAGLNELGFACKRPPATFYLWVKVGEGAREFCEKALEKNVVVTPGAGFGRHGGGFVRFTATQGTERLEQALARLEQIT